LLLNAMCPQEAFESLGNVLPSIVRPKHLVATLALGLRPRQRGYKVAGQEEAWELRQEEARESHDILPGVLESVREYEGVNPHTPKATPTLGDGVPVDSRNFREQLQGSNLNLIWLSLYHWKVLEA
jgi:hypothetical protein